ncbi:trypsin inhibitor-like [Prorops nasuta]|uniref:trypsin inhibitor-like n=1 Tax=Prorops nasuta TaxID=863751 RepID=UPI0034CFFE15
MNTKTILLLVAVVCSLFILEATAVDEICQFPLERGPCRAFLRRYGYDSKLGKCVSFVYGGCQGNSNSFPNIETCQAACQS